MTLQEKLNAIDKISDNINKKAGKVIMGRLGKSEEIKQKLQIEYIPTPSKNINDAIGGGFPRKRMTIVAGNPDSGKTSLLLETIGYNQSKNPDFIACWLESESSLELDYVTKTFHIDPERFLYIEHEREGAGEAALDKIESVLAASVCDMVVINSLKCLVPKEEMDNSISKSTIALQARMNSRMTKKFTSLVTESNAAFIVVTHLSTDIGSVMMRDNKIIAGGEAIKYASALTIDLRKRSIQDSDPITALEGVKIGLTVKKNHCTPAVNPYLKTEYFAIFGQGIEQYLETLQNAINQGILTQNGAMIRDIDQETGEIRQWNGSDLVWRGKGAYREFMAANPDYFQNLRDRVNGLTVEMSKEEVENAKAEENKLAESISEDLKDIIEE